MVQIGGIKTSMHVLYVCKMPFKCARLPCKHFKKLCFSALWQHTWILHNIKVPPLKSKRSAKFVIKLLSQIQVDVVLKMHISLELEENMYYHWWEILILKNINILETLDFWYTTILQKLSFDYLIQKNGSSK